MKTFLSAILSGIFISIGCIVNLKVGGVAGAVLFSFGLLSVCYYGVKLYTGTAGVIRIWWRDDWKSLLWILVGNVVGCIITSLAARESIPEIIEPARAICDGRIARGIFSDILLAIGCGIIMTTAVQQYRENGKVLTILVGVPVFILCGFAHSIADCFYYTTAGAWGNIWLIWLGEVFGNFIGCNISRCLIIKSN